MVSLRPFVIFAIRMMGPGPRRLEMVKLVHDMNDSRGDMQPFAGRLQIAPGLPPQTISSQRAA